MLSACTLSSSSISSAAAVAAPFVPAILTLLLLTTATLARHGAAERETGVDASADLLCAVECHADSRVAAAFAIGAS